MDNNDAFHVPQQSRRHHLRHHPDFLSPLHLHHHNNHHHHHDQIIDHHQQHLVASPTTSALNLSLSTHARGGGGGGGGGGAFNATPVGPFTGYSSILARSRFLRPAQDLLEGFSVANGGDIGGCGGRGGGGGVVPSSTLTATKSILEDSRSLFSDEDEDVSRRCTNPNLVSMLHEVYKRYKLYCQQMQSAVTSFESVAGLANAAPFISFAVRAMFRHFHCLKNAILDQIRKGFGGADCRRDRDSGSCSEDKGPYDEKHTQGANFLQHPVWRSQRGFPDKAVTVLRTWLFEHFLHPYPSDSDKQMLAQKTGLSRSQVSNWFTNARVRLWKPMVEEMHALERKSQGSKTADTAKFINLSADSHSTLHPQLTEDFEIMNHRRDHESQSKRSKIEAIPREEQSSEQFGLPCHHLSGNHIISIGENQIGQLSHSPTLPSNQQITTGLPWSPQGQIIPFWLARQ